MGDVYARIKEVEPAVVDKVAHAMEVSAADPQHRDMVSAYLADLRMPPSARVLEIGCGTGAIARLIASRDEVSEVVGVDPSPALLARARALSSDHPRLQFVEGDGRELSQPSDSFDAVVVHRVLSHVPNPERVLAEAARVVRRGGRLAVFDGDYATITLANSSNDPLQSCVAAFAPTYITDPWIVRRLATLIRDAGFASIEVRSHGYVQIHDAAYMASIADRGADALVASGVIGDDLGGALKAEARRRLAIGSFFGHIAYASFTATRSERTTVTTPAA